MTNVQWPMSKEVPRTNDHAVVWGGILGVGLLRGLLFLLGGAVGFDGGADGLEALAALGGEGAEEGEGADHYRQYGRVQDGGVVAHDLIIGSRPLHHQRRAITAKYPPS